MAQTVGQASRPTWRTVPRGRIAKCRPRGQRESLLSLTCLLALPQARFPGADDGLRPVSNLQLGEDHGDVVANGLQHVATRLNRVAHWMHVDALGHPLREAISTVNRGGRYKWAV